jgi:hypothetical protein
MLTIHDKLLVGKDCHAYWDFGCGVSSSSNIGLLVIIAG